jgi:hypothetical protein
MIFWVKAHTLLARGVPARSFWYDDCRCGKGEYARSCCREEKSMTVLVVVLVLILIGALPVYPYSREWGYYPSGILSVAVAAVALTLL